MFMDTQGIWLRQLSYVTDKSIKSYRDIHTVVQKYGIQYIGDIQIILYS